MEWNKRALGATGLSITPLTVGGALIGSMPETFGYEVTEEAGIATAVAALTGPIRAMESSSAYGRGESERRIGKAIAQVGGVPDDFVLATKITRDLDTGDFSGEQMRRSIAGSLERLGIASVPLLYLHDPENTTFGDAMSAGGPVDVLRELKDTGIAGSIGIAGGDTSTITPYVETGLFDVLLTHNRWTLVNRTADGMIDAAVERGMGVVNAAVFGGGILAAGASSSSRYGYREAPEALLDAVRRIEALCVEASIPLAAAAVQFSAKDARIASTIVGVSRPERIAENVAAVEIPIPSGFWDEIEPLIKDLPTDIGPR
jgi:D-threo-aldose 1-dehydrogenase